MDDSLWAPNSSPTFHGSASSMVNFEDVRGESTPESRRDEFDACFHQPEKKRRLSHDQVRFLEKSFEIENKLEPERKIQLAKEIGLQPRQVAIWFQNRRARYKTRVLEREYGSLKASYDKLKLDYDALLKENERIKNEVNLLTEKVVMRENEKVDSRPKIAAAVEASSGKSDVFDSDSSHCNDGNHSAAADSWHGFEGSDFSQEEDESLMMMPPACLEMECCDDLQPNSGNLGFPVQDQGTWFWHI